AMGAGRILGAGSRWAGALLVTVMPSPSPPPRAFLYQIKIECYFTNAPGGSGICTGTSTTGGGRALRQRPGGVYVADTELGRPAPRGWNKDPAILAQMRGEADRFCRHNYEAALLSLSLTPVQPKVKVSPMKSESQPHSHLLVCSVTGFYPSGIEIKWLKNGQEQTAGVVSTELLQNGDWTFQILVMLEMSPRRGDVYTCQVEHISLRGPLTVHWAPRPVGPSPPGSPCAPCSPLGKGQRWRAGGAPSLTAMGQPGPSWGDLAGLMCRSRERGGLTWDCLHGGWESRG
uniref:Ig-like domain-containing protein n=1 Tax=Chelonoidis abingdonii TaxID=106734 RepID=A0A8C0GA92_CHEAB